MKIYEKRLIVMHITQVLLDIKVKTVSGYCTPVLGTPVYLIPQKESDLRSTYGNYFYVYFQLIVNSLSIICEVSSM